jgi:threonine synthase
MWRYAPLLPASGIGPTVSLGEGMSPLIRLSRVIESAPVSAAWLKDEGINPGGSAEARAASCVFTVAHSLGLTTWRTSCDGVAGPAFALYGAAAGIPVRLTLPPNASTTSWLAAAAAGALPDADAPLQPEAAWQDQGRSIWPYRVEGLKTIGLEIAEQLRWIPPSAVLCPVGDGVGLIAVWKAFEELAAVGWLTGDPPRLFAVQPEGCAPLVRAFELGLEQCEDWPDPLTLAPSMRAPRPDGDDLLLKILRSSGGAAIAVADHEMLDAALELAHAEGVFVSPEGGACLAALRRLRGQGLLSQQDSVVLLNPASGFLCPEVYSARFVRSTRTEQDKLGGLITPR